MVRTLGRIAWIAIAVIALAASAPSQAQDRRRPGEGVMCLLALYAAASHVADACHPGEAPALAAELRTASDQLGRYVVENGWTVSKLTSFLREQAHVQDPPETLCRSGAEMVYQMLANSRPEDIRGAAEAATTEPGEPSWGDCL